MAFPLLLVGMLPAVRLYDDTTGELAEVELRPRMSIYVCGITPYDAAHLGHAFTYVHFDVLVRYFRHLGSDVVHVQNVTDVDDDILRTATERGVDPAELAERENADFERAMRLLNINPPTISPWASEFVPAMVREVDALLQARSAYERNGTVYFRVASDARYGTLSGLSRDEMLELAAERGGRPDDPDKDDPLDFVLWQPSGENEPSWPSPWGSGRPGWHIECSTMARRLLGQPVDIHGGGSDLIFPHHECERAQAEALSGGTAFVRQWVHTGTVFCGGEKMSKSLGNLVFVGDLLDRYDAACVRSWLLRRHYRGEWEFDEDELAKLSQEGPFLSGAPTATGDGSDREAFFRALEDDLDTPSAMRILDNAASSSDPASTALLEEGRKVLGIGSGI